MVARWKPVHLGHQRVLQALQGTGAELIVGIGSANRYDERNPFTPAETEAMLWRVLSPERTRVIWVDDLDNPPLWAARLAARLGPLEAFVTANERVAACMAPYYPLLHPARLLSPEQRLALNATQVRECWRRQEPWQHLVPPPVAAFLWEHGLVERYLRDFAEVRA